MGNEQAVHRGKTNPLKDKFSIKEKYMGHETLSKGAEDKGILSRSRVVKFEVCSKFVVYIATINI